jgi:hypothetical protein
MYKNDKFLRVLIILFKLEAIYFVLSIVLKGIDIYYLLSLINKSPIVEQFGNYWLLKSNIVYYSSIIIQLIAWIPFIIWFYREYSNIHKIYSSDKLSYKPIMAIFSFMIPILNFVLPYKIMKEIVEGYNNKSKQETTINRFHIKIWWISFISFAVYMRIISSRNPELANDFLTNTYHYIAIDLCGLIYVFFTIWILKQLKIIIKHSTE